MILAAFLAILASAGATGSGELRVLNESFHGGNSNTQMWMRATGLPGHSGMVGVFVGALVLLIIGALIFHLARNLRQEKGESRSR